jgi:hypothetical protein
MDVEGAANSRDLLKDAAPSPATAIFANFLRVIFVSSENSELRSMSGELPDFKSRRSQAGATVNPHPSLIPLP